MTKPIDEQLSNIVLNGIWKKTHHLRVDLGMLMLDNSVVRYDKQPYHEMVKDEKEDMSQCKVV